MLALPAALFALTCLPVPQGVPSGEAKAADADHRVTITGRVLDDRGKGLPGARVHCGTWEELRAGGGKGPKPLGMTDPEGGFRIRVAPDTERQSPHARHVLVTAPGRISARFAVSTAASTLRPDLDVDLGVFRLPTGTPVAGRVRTKDGRPLAGVSVISTPQLGGAVLSYAGYGRRVPDYVSLAVSDARGGFLVFGLPGAGVQLQLSKPGYYLQQVPFASPKQPLVVEMQPSGFVRGRVVTHEGKPVFARLSVRSEVMGRISNVTGMPVAENFTNEDGSFQLSLETRHRYVIWASGWDVRMRTGTRQNRYSDVLSGPQDDVVIRMKKPAGVDDRVVVTAVGADGKALRDFRVAVVWMRKAAFRNQNRSTLFRTWGRQATGGKVIAKGPGSGRVREAIVMVRADGHAEYVADLQWKDGEPVRLSAKLKRESVITGSAVDARTGAPIADAMVTYRRIEPKKRKDGRAVALAAVGGFAFSTASPMNIEATPTDIKGGFRIRGLAPGRYRLEVVCPKRLRPKAQEIEIKEQGAEVGVLLKVPSGLRLSGKITGAKPRPGWRIQLVPRQRNQVIMLSGWPVDFTPGAEALVRSDGTFTFEGLEKKEYTIQLLMPRRFSPGKLITINLGESVGMQKDNDRFTLDLSDHAPARVHGKLVITGVKPPPGRLAVVATTPLEGEFRGFRGFIMTVQVDGPMAPVQGDGSFEFYAPPDKRELRLVDLATGTTLKKWDEIEIDPGRDLEQNLGITLCPVEVELLPRKEGGLFAASLLEIEVDGAATANPQQVLFTVLGGAAGPGVRLFGDRRKILLYLPPVQVKFRVRSNIYQVSRDSSHVRLPPLAEKELTPQAGKMNRLQLRVAPPPKIDRKDA